MLLVIVWEILPDSKGGLDAGHGALDSHVSCVDKQIVVIRIGPVTVEIFVSKGIPVRLRFVDIAFRILKIGVRIPHDVADSDLPGSNDAHTEGLLGWQDELRPPSDDDCIAMLADCTDYSCKMEKVFIRPDVICPKHGIYPRIP